MGLLLKIYIMIEFIIIALVPNFILTVWVIKIYCNSLIEEHNEISGKLDQYKDFKPVEFENLSHYNKN